MIFCTRCGAENTDGTKFCIRCGTSLTDDASGTKQMPVQEAAEGNITPASKTKKPKNKKALIIGIVAAIVVIAAVVVTLLVMTGNESKNETRASSDVVIDDGAQDVVFEFDYFKLALPKDIADKLSISESNDSVMISGANDGPTIAVLYPQNQKLAGEYRYASYSLGEVYIGGHYESAMMDLPYIDADNKNMHAASSEQGELAVSKLLGLTPEEFAGHISLNNGSRFVEANAELISDMSSNEGSGSSSSMASGQNAHAVSDVTEPFWGVWDGAYKEKEKADAEASQIKKDSGYDATVFLTSDWSNLNSESWYAISIGVYSAESEAKDALASIKKDYPNAYVKYSGDRK